MVVQIKALACEIPWESDLPLSRFSTRDVANEAISRGIVASISNATVWRWLNADAIRPWRFRSWIFPRDPNFEEKATRVLDLYHGKWRNKQLKENEYIISADEKTSIQARHRVHPSQPPAKGRNTRIEHEYKREGALHYLAAWDVQRAKIFGRCESKTGIVPFGRLVSHVMSQEPYRSAKRVFWIVDNGSSHRGETSVKRIKEAWSNCELVHLPVHASWLNQIEIYFSIVQRKVLTPNDFTSCEEIEIRLLQFQKEYEKIAKPFEWLFTRDDLSRVLNKLKSKNRVIIAA